MSSPELDITVDIVEGAGDVAALPTRPGVFALEDVSSRTLALACTANLRRMVQSKLASPSSEAGASRKVNYRDLARRVLAKEVHSAFEADWLYLQLARKRLPATYRAMLDRWQAWFVQCDPNAEFPQWTKTAHPKVDGQRAILGPFPDKHAAGRYLDLLHDAFDLCRYHHILVQAPNAAACAYKEMKRCAAPCDGSVGMDAYRQLIHSTVAFGCTPIDEYRAEIESQMNNASAQLRFEEAQRLQNLLDRTKPATRADFAYVDRIENFTYLGLVPTFSRKESKAQVIIICGGHLEVLEPLSLNADESEATAALRRALAQTSAPEAHLQEMDLENMGLICAHLFRSKNVRHSGVFFRLNKKLTATAVLKSLRALHRRIEKVSEEEPDLIDQETENLAAGSELQ